MFLKAVPLKLIEVIVGAASWSMCLFFNDLGSFVIPVRARCNFVTAFVRRIESSVVLK